MKRILTAAFSLLLILSAINLNAQMREKQAFVKEKKVTKTFTAGSNKLSIDNSFGNVKITTWDKNEIKVDVHIEASADKEDLAEKVFNHISIVDKQTGNDISFKTTFAKNGASCKDCKMSMYIDYQIYMPATTPFTLENSFGNSELPDLSGAVSLSSKFGNLQAGSLTNLQKLQIEFGKADVKSLSNIKATFKFSKITIGNLSGKNELKLEFCDYTIITMDKNLTELDIKESYSNINLRPVVNFSATYSIKLNFGNFTDRTSSNIKRTDTPDKYGPDSNRKYAGQTGTGAAKIDISSSFGNIILGEATADDMKKEEKKSKKKEI